MDNKIYGYIYKLTSPSGGVYIGQTIDIERRYGEYNRSHSRKHKTKIYYSVSHHGWENFKKEILFKGYTTYDKLNDLEIELIKKYDSVNNGLNLAHGGFNGKHSEETKAKMRESALKLNSDKNYAKWRNRGWIGRKHTEDTKIKMRANSSHKGASSEFLNEIRESGLVKVRKIVINKQTGVFYDSIIKASEAAGMNYRTFKNKVNGSKRNDTYFEIV